MNRTACLLWQQIIDAEAKSVAVVGMAKNTGKTVSLNHLLQQAYQAGKRVGVTSIGRDGETRDQVFDIPKPTVRVWPGMFVVTALQTLNRATARIRQVHQTEIRTIMGPLVLVEIKAAGTMEVAGPTTTKDQQAVNSLLQKFDVDLVFIDGALGRSSHASPTLADGVVLATGAALGGSMRDVCGKTEERLKLLTVPQVGEGLQQRCQALFATGGVALWNAAGELLFQESIATLNAAKVLLSHASHEVAIVACSGAVGRSLWYAIEDLARRYSGFVLVVADATRLFVDWLDIERLRRMGGEIFTQRGTKILAVTLNPASPIGHTFDAAEFSNVAGQYFDPLLSLNVASNFSSTGAQDTPLSTNFFNSQRIAHGAINS